MDIEDLEQEIGDGRPFGMRQKKYDLKRERLTELLGKLGSRSRRSPDSRFRFFLASSWQKDTESLRYFEKTIRNS
jgi:hypothetical protein